LFQYAYARRGILVQTCRLFSTHIVPDTDAPGCQGNIFTGKEKQPLTTKR